MFTIFNSFLRMSSSNYLSFNFKIILKNLTILVLVICYNFDKKLFRDV